MDRGKILSKVSEAHSHEDPLSFDESQLPKPEPHYVMWIDIMGSAKAMSHSLPASSNHIGRLHAAIIRNKLPGVQTYPVMDGAYITSTAQKEILKMLKGVFTDCAQYFLDTAEPRHRFLVRAGLAFGPVVHGGTINEKVCITIANDSSYSASLLFGIPIVQAYRSEGSAPPFGLSLDESARAFAPPRTKPLKGLWYEWWKNGGPPIGFKEALLGHLDWCKSHHLGIEYPIDRLNIHRQMVEQYFP